MVPSILLTALKEGFQKLINTQREVRDAVKALRFPDLDTRAIVAGLRDVATAVRAQKPELKTTVKVDQADLLKEMKALRKSIDSLTLPDLDTSDIVAAIKAQRFEQKDIDLSPVVEAVKANKTTVPDVFKLDSQQLARLSVGGAGVAPMTMATRITNTTVSIANASTEGSYTFPSGTVGWVIKIRAQNVLGYYSWTTGKLPTSGDGSTYMTIPQNFLRSQQDVEYSGKTIYLGAAAAATFELEIFRR